MVLPAGKKDVLGNDDSTPDYMAEAVDQPDTKTYRQQLDEIERKLNEELDRVNAARRVLDQLVKIVG